MVGFVHLRKVALPQHIRELEDIVLDLFADWLSYLLLIDL
jgi:hypothetical protein